MEDKDKQGEGGQGRTTPEGHSEKKGKHYRCHSAYGHKDAYTNIQVRHWSLATVETGVVVVQIFLQVYKCWAKTSHIAKHNDVDFGGEERTG